MFTKIIKLNALSVDEKWVALSFIVGIDLIKNLIHLKKKLQYVSINNAVVAIGCYAIYVTENIRHSSTYHKHDVVVEKKDILCASELWIKKNMRNWMNCLRYDCDHISLLKCHLRWIR